jgi:small subunit ribosomal protein S20
LPNIKAAEKWALQSEKRAMRNKSIKGRLKTLFRSATAAGEPAGARTVQGAFDKAAAKGIIHPNKAARKKSRLAKALARAAVTPAAGPKTKSTRSKKQP